MALLVTWGAGGCSGDEFAEVGVGVLSVSPETLTFNAQEIDVADVQFLTVSNIGRGELIITDLELVTASTEFSIVEVEFPIRLEPDQDRVIEVWYTPADCRSDRGNLVIHSNDRERLEYTVPLQPQELTGQVFVNPSPVDFGRVPSGTDKTIAVNIQNSGTCALTVNDLFISGSFDFEFTEAAGEERTTFEPDLPFTLETGDTYTIDITYHPLNDGYDEATMLISSDDARDRTVEVPVVANGDQACIVVTDEEGIDFGQRFIGETHPKTITITNCSQSEDLEVTAIGLSEHDELGGFERYSLDDVPDLTTALTVAPQQSEAFIINFTPILYTPENNPECSEEPCEVTDGAVLTIESNDEVKSPLDIDVRGIGTNNHCPTAVARARVCTVDEVNHLCVSSTGPWDTQIDSIPLNGLEFDGRNSTDAEGDIAAYQWEVTSRPDGSVSTFTPDAQAPNPQFFLDLAGQYLFTLRVFDEQGVESCDPATVTAIVVPDEHIHVQLVWETPGDPDRTDTGIARGSDVDLHFMHPNGTWNRAPWDCYWMNKVPNWGDTRPEVEDNPSLDIDDTDGWGPENINLNNPEGTAAAPVTYKVGVFYFADHGFGPSDVTVRIYLDGVERFSNTFPGLEDRQFWDVARITWPTRDIERIHRLYPSGSTPCCF